jgi:hypothetical protein
MPILAKWTAEITACKTKRKYPGAGFKLIKRFFLDWVNCKSCNKSIIRDNSLATLVASYTANAKTAVFNNTIIWT